MPDLLTHSLLNLVLPWGRLRRDELGVFVFGGVLPDLISRVPAMALGRWLQPVLSDDMDIDWFINGFSALHLPAGYAAAAVFLASALPRFMISASSRLRVFTLLLGGGLIHLGMDMFQSHLRPAYRYLFPLSLRPMELGWFDPDLGFYSWPLLVPLAWFAWRRSPRLSK